MTQTPSNNGNSSRLDRIEAILERTVTDREVDRQEINELRSALTQLTTQTVANNTELRSALEQLTGRVNNLVERMGRYQEETAFNNSELARGQAIMTDLARQLTLGQVRLEQAIVEIKETQASLTAAQERQERILDYLIRRSE